MEWNIPYMYVHNICIMKGIHTASVYIYVHRTFCCVVCMFAHDARSRKIETVVITFRNAN